MNSDPGFLFNNRPSMRERDEQRALALAHRRAGLACYRAATAILVLAMTLLAVPAAAPWAWQVAGAAAALMTALAAAIFRKGLHSHAVLCLLCAWAVLPVWIFAAPHVLGAVADLARALAGHWRASLNPP
jgi:hypothetical protein